MDQQVFSVIANLNAKSQAHLRIHERGNLLPQVTFTRGDTPDEIQLQNTIDRHELFSGGRQGSHNHLQQAW